MPTSCRGSATRRAATFTWDATASAHDRVYERRDSPKPLEVGLDHQPRGARRRAPRAPSRGRAGPSTRRRRGRGARRCRGRATDRCARGRASRATRRRKRRATSSSTECDDARRDDVVAGLVVLEHEPHRAHVVAGVPPVRPRREVAEHELRLEAERDRGRRPCDLAREEVDGPERRLVVVEDPAGREHAVPLAVAAGDEVGVGLRDAVRRQRARRGLLRLRRLTRLAEDLARRRLVEADPGSTSRIASSIEVAPTAANSAVRIGSSHERGTNDGAARL